MPPYNSDILQIIISLLYHYYYYKSMDLNKVKNCLLDYIKLTPSLKLDFDISKALNTPIEEIFIFRD